MKAYKGGKTPGSKEQPKANRLQAIKQAIKPEMITIPNASEHKYSAMLLALIEPYQSARPDVDEVDRLLILAMYAWNIANLKKELPEMSEIMNKDIRDTLKGNKKELKLLTSMINDKAKKFNNDDLYIIGYEITEGKGDNINVITRAGALEAFLAATLFDEEEEGEYNYEPAYINRTALLVKAREPFMAWLKRTDDRISPDEEMLESTIYLMEAKETPKEIEAWIKNNFDRIFIKELEDWDIDESFWPQNMTFTLFREWFDVSFHSMIYDLEDYPVEKDLL